MNDKERYIKYAETNFAGKALEIVLNQINLFYKENHIEKKQYKIGEEVILEKGTYLHGILGGLDKFDWIIQNGFIGNNFTKENVKNKIKNSIGMWVIREKEPLKDYIIRYSGFTITYTIGRGPDSKEISELIPYHKFDQVTEEINNREDVWMYWGDQTKEVRFLPSLVANKNQIGFILNMNNEIAQEMIKADVWNPEIDSEILRPFLDYRYYDKFVENDRINRTAQTTDRETAIIFGLPSTLIEGIIVGRKIEKDEKSMDYIKSKLPDCYICNLDGKVIR